MDDRAMVADSGKSLLGLEYFDWENGEPWSLSEKALLDTAISDLRVLRLVDPTTVEDAFVVWYAKTYHVYDDGYRERVQVIRKYLDCFTNVVYRPIWPVPL